MSNVPVDLFFAKTHEWVLVEENVATIGISDHAQSELGDITFVELPEDDTEINAGDEAANIESVKAASPVFSPVGGVIIEVNPDLEDTPENINHDPYDSGWIFKVEMSDKSDLDNLMSAEEYEEFIAEA
jgi:glycine cleavage system H protein